MSLNLNRTGEASQSRVDLFSGKHTTSLIVAALFLLTFIGLIILVCIKSKEEMPDDLITGLVGLLGVLAGFFAGSTSMKNKE